MAGTNASRIAYNGAGGSITIADAIAPNTLVVIDFICFSFTQPASAVGANIQIDSRIVLAKSPGSNSLGDGLQFNWSGGYPCWANSAIDDAPDTSVAIVGTCTGSTANTMLVGYHYENPAGRRSMW
jgi:hypothetical protein